MIETIFFIGILAVLVLAVAPVVIILGGYLLLALMDVVVALTAVSLQTLSEYLASVIPRSWISYIQKSLR